MVRVKNHFQTTQSKVLICIEMDGGGSLRYFWPTKDGFNLHYDPHFTIKINMHATFNVSKKPMH